MFPIDFTIFPTPANCKRAKSQSNCFLNMLATIFILHTCLLVTFLCLPIGALHSRQAFGAIRHLGLKRCLTSWAAKYQHPVRYSSAIKSATLWVTKPWPRPCLDGLTMLLLGTTTQSRRQETPVNQWLPPQWHLGHLGQADCSQKHFKS